VSDEPKTPPTIGSIGRTQGVGVPTSGFTELALGEPAMTVYANYDEKFPDFWLIPNRGSSASAIEVKMPRADYEAWKAAKATIRRIEDVIKEQIGWDD